MYSSWIILAANNSVPSNATQLTTSVRFLELIILLLTVYTYAVSRTNEFERARDTIFFGFSCIGLSAVFIAFDAISTLYQFSGDVENPFWFSAGVIIAWILANALAVGSIALSTLVTEIVPQYIRDNNVNWGVLKNELRGTIIVVIFMNSFLFLSLIADILLGDDRIRMIIVILTVLGILSLIASLVLIAVDQPDATQKELSYFNDEE
jgi:hypothetical protein